MEDEKYDKIVVAGNILIVFALFTAFIFSMQSDTPGNALTGLVTSPGEREFGASTVDNNAAIDFNANADKQVIETANRVMQRIESYPGAKDAIRQYSEQYGVPEPLIYSLITQESRGKIGDTSVTGAMGLMQIQWGTAKQVCDSVSSPSELQGVDNVRNNVRCGIKILLDKYKLYHGGKDPFGCGWDKYEGWQGALRGYNGMCCTFTSDQRCSACHTNPERCDDDYVEHVLRFYPAFNGSSKELQQNLTIPERDKAANYNSRASYSVKPRTKFKMDYDLGIYDTLKEQSDKLLSECSIKDDIENCVKKQAARNSDGDLNWNVGSCQDSYKEMFFDFVKSFETCLQSPATGCVCNISYPSNNFVKSEQEIVFSIDAKTGRLEMASPLSYTYYSEVLENTSIKLDDDTKIDFINLYLNYKGDKIESGRAVMMHASSQGTAQEIFRPYNSLKVRKQQGSVLLTDKFNGKECELNPRQFRFCVETGKKSYVYSSIDNNYKEKEHKIRFALTIMDKIAPGPVEDVQVSDKTDDDETINITWDDNPEQDVLEYKIYISENQFSSPDSNLLKKSVPDSGKNYSAIVNVTEDDKLYHIGVTAVDAAGNEKQTISTVSGKSIDDLPPGPVNKIPAAQKGSQTLMFEWPRPVKNIDKSKMDDLAGFTIRIDDKHFKVYDGQDFVKTYDVAVGKCKRGECQSTVQKSGLSAGQYFFTVTAYDNAGNEYSGSVETVMLVI